MIQDAPTGRGYLTGPSWPLIRASCFKLAEKAVLLVLWSHSDADGHSWPSLTVLARESCCDVRTVSRSIKLLEDKGLLRKERGVGKESHYWLSETAVTEYVTTHKNADGADAEPPTKMQVPQKGSTHKNADVPPSFLQEPPTNMPVLPPTKMYYEVNQGSKPISNPEEVEDAPTKNRRTPQPVRVESWGTYQTQAGYTDAMLTEFGATLGPEWVRDKITEILDHSARKKRTRMDLYVGNWLREDAAKALRFQQAAGPPGRNGHRAAPQDQGGDFYGIPQEKREEGRLL